MLSAEIDKDGDPEEKAEDSKRVLLILTSLHTSIGPVIGTRYEKTFS